MKLTIGSQIVMPEPAGDDAWQIGGFVARVTDIIEKTGNVIVEDQDCDFFTIELERAEKATIYEEDLF